MQRCSTSDPCFPFPLGHHLFSSSAVYWPSAWRITLSAALIKSISNPDPTRAPLPPRALTLLPQPGVCPKTEQNRTEQTRTQRKNFNFNLNSNSNATQTLPRTCCTFRQAGRQLSGARARACRAWQLLINVRSKVCAATTCNSSNNNCRQLPAQQSGELGRSENETQMPKCLAIWPTARRQSKSQLSSTQ